jgi:hypothetical protein
MIPQLNNSKDSKDCITMTLLYSSKTYKYIVLDP